MNAETIEVNTTSLPKTEKKLLNLIVNAVRLFGVTPTVAVTYVKQTDKSARKPGVDYLVIPGTKASLHLGEVIAADFNKKGELFLIISDQARANGKTNGWTALSVKGIRSIQLRSSKTTLMNFGTVNEV